MGHPQDRTRGAPEKNLNNGMDLSAERSYLTLEKVLSFCSKTAHAVQHCPWHPSVVYITGNLLVKLHLENGAQQAFLGHSAPVTAFAFSVNGQILASIQGGTEGLVRIWQYSSTKCLTILCAQFEAACALDISGDGKALVAAGRGPPGRQLLAIWDISNVSVTGSAPLIIKQATGYHIERVRFPPHLNNELVSCGADNIRVYRFQNSQLRGCAVQLGAYRLMRPKGLPTDQGQNFGSASISFTDLSFEGNGQSSLADVRMFVSSTVGAIFQVNYTTKQVEHVFQVHTGSIRSIAVTNGFCATGSDDHYLRVWPLDFTDFFLETRHDGPVTSVSVSGDGLRIVAGTQGGYIGAVDMATQQYSVLLSTHTDAVKPVTL